MSGVRKRFEKLAEVRHRRSGEDQSKLQTIVPQLDRRLKEVNRPFFVTEVCEVSDDQLPGREYSLSPQALSRFAKALCNTLGGVRTHALQHNLVTGDSCVDNRPLFAGSLHKNPVRRPQQ